VSRQTSPTIIARHAAWAEGRRGLRQIGFGAIDHDGLTDAAGHDPVHPVANHQIRMAIARHDSVSRPGCDDALPAYETSEGLELELEVFAPASHGVPVRPLRHRLRELPTNLIDVDRGVFERERAERLARVSIMLDSGRCADLTVHVMSIQPSRDVPQGCPGSWTQLGPTVYRAATGGDADDDRHDVRLPI
jgi:hypothetical protein